MPDPVYRILANHHRELRRLFERLEPDHPGRERIGQRVEEARQALRDYVRARTAHRRS